MSIGTRCSGAKVSGWRNIVTRIEARPAIARTTKIIRQPASKITPEPASGASIGETEITSITIAISRVAAGPVY